VCIYFLFSICHSLVNKVVCVSCHDDDDSNDYRQSFQVLECLYPAGLTGGVMRPGLADIVHRSLVSTLSVDDRLCRRDLCTTP